MQRRSVWVALCALGLWCLTVPVQALADDVPPGIEKFYSQRYEVRLGAFMHAVGSVEKGSADINAELIFPKLWTSNNGWWSMLIPRPHVGFMVNTASKTNFVYGGGLWTFDLTNRFFVETFLGGAFHDAPLDNNPVRVALGCRTLFHVGGSVGYRLTQNWSVMGTFDHLSNGNAVLNGCQRNQGINEYGIRVGYTF